MKKFLAVILSSLLILSCSQKQIRLVLRDVESYIQERPDSALSVLENIDTLQLTTSSLRAQYALLYAMALDKNYVDTTGIHIILPALTYFTKDNQRGMMANYYAGRIYENGQNYSNALFHYSAALERVEADDYQYQGLIYSAMGDAYHLAYSVEEELSCHQKAYAAFQMLGDAHYLDLAIFGLANAYHNNQDFRTADSLYTILCSRGDSLSSTVLAAKLALADNALKSETFDIKNVCTLLESAMSNGAEMTLESYYEYAYVLILSGENKRAGELMNSLSQYPDSYVSYWWRYKIEQARGNHQEAEALLESSIRLQDLIIREKINQSVFKSMSEHYRFSMLSAKQDQIIIRQKYSIAVALFALVLAVIFLVYESNKRRLEKENERMLMTVEESEKLLRILKDDTDTIRAENTSHKEAVLNLQRMYVTLYQKQFFAIGKQYDASFNGNSEVVSQRIIRQVSSEVEGILSEIAVPSGKQSKFEERINRDAEGIISKIREDYPRFSEEDIRFICYIVAGFDATAISVLMNISGENARVKRHRIKRRLLNDKGKNAELYKIWFG